MKNILDEVDSGGVKASENVYSTLKLFSHPDVVRKINNKEHVSPILIQFMPQNLCPHDCEFCSYRRRGNKNNEMFDDKESIPLEKTLEIINDAKAMGVKAFEITGGGEPTAYKFFREMIQSLVDNDLDIGIVSNGVGLKEEYIKIMSKKLLWSRISIDAGSKEDYCRIRRCPESHWDRAWSAVENLAKFGSHKEFVLGAGFVVTPDNYQNIVEGVRLMKEHGAHNVRISAAFTEKYLDYYSLGQIGGVGAVVRRASDLAKEAKSLFEDKNFKVYNLFDERISNMSVGVQDYDFCVAKEVVCVIGGDQKVYTCCSLAFNKKGFVGDISNMSFKEMWNSDKTVSFFSKHNPKNICKIMCLYEYRNKEFLKHRYEDIRLDQDMIHKNFP
jgi:MoaA/NifB/PqqE/SkfB family radical SAM enzyme